MGKKGKGFCKAGAEQNRRCKTAAEFYHNNFSGSINNAGTIKLADGAGVTLESHDSLPAIQLAARPVDPGITWVHNRGE